MKKTINPFIYMYVDPNTNAIFSGCHSEPIDIEKSLIITPYQKEKNLIVLRKNFNVDPLCKKLYLLGFKDGFVEEIFSLHQIFNDIMLGDQKLLENEENINVAKITLANDTMKVIFVQKVVKQIRKYDNPFFIGFDDKDLTNKLRQRYHREYIETNMNLLIRVSICFKNLSGELRAHFRKYLGPKPFTWETFEHLGGILNHNRYFTQLRAASSENYTFNFLKENHTRKDFIRIAFLDIVKEDFPELEKMLGEMLNYLRNKSQNLSNSGIVPTHINLIATKTLVSRIFTQENITKLIDLCVNHFPNKDQYEEKRKNIGSENRFIILRTTTFNFFSEKKLYSKISKQSVLWRIIQIGELCTSKALDLCFQENVDIDLIRILTKIRDALVHQDIFRNKKIVDEVLNENNGVLNKIVTNEMKLVYEQFINILKNMYNYDKNLYKEPQTLWNELRNEARNIQKNQKEKYSHRQKQILALIGSNPSLKDKITCYFSNEIANLNLNVEEESFFNETILNRPKRGNIWTSAVNEKDHQLEITHNNWKKKYPNFFNLYSDFYDRKGEYHRRKGLTFDERIESSLEGINNLKEILLNFHLVHNSTSFENWESINKVKLSEIQKAFQTDHEIFNALQYNIGQSLQHFDTLRKELVKKYESIILQDYKLLGEKYDSYLRPLRNYIIHGDRLLDLPKSNVDYSTNTPSDKINFLIHTAQTLILDFAPELINLKEKLKENQKVNDKNEWSEYIREREKQKFDYTISC